MEIRSSISKEEMLGMPQAAYHGKICVLPERFDNATQPDTYSALTDAIDYLSRQKHIGIDSETRPMFRKGEVNKVALLQLATPDVCFLIRLCTGISLEPIVRLLQDKDVIKVGLSLKDDNAMLRQVIDFTPGNWIDMQNVVGKYGITDRSLQKIYACLFGERISKRQQLSRWDAPQLSEQQCAYAALDAYAPLRIYHKLMNTEL